MPAIRILSFFLNLNLIKKLLNDFKDHEIIISNNGGYPASWNCIASIIAAKKIGITKRFLLIHHESSDFFFLLKYTYLLPFVLKTFTEP